MNRVLLIILSLLGCVFQASADHITGGEISYTFTGTSNGYYNYSIMVRMFMRCNSGRQFNDPTIISIFDRGTGARISDYSVNIAQREVLSMNNTDPCITNPPVVCYELAYYRFSVSLPAASGGYVITAHVNFRIDGINNLTSGYNRVGATYIGEIPSLATENGPENSSAHFTGEDLVIVCAENSFTYSFAATDADGDELRYSFCDAYRTSSGGGFGNNVEPPPPPPYQSVPYGNGFAGITPLGNNVRIDPETGLITGIAPKAGTYIVTVCVEEIRNGKVIATQHKDLQINIAPCSVTAAALPEEYMLCGDSKTLFAQNLSTSSLINSYSWEFTNRSGDVIYASGDPAVTYTFADTGLYNVKLVINRNQQCTDSVTSVARVYPGFAPDFLISSPCISRPAQFTDATTSALGTVSAWNWDFGEATTTLDISDDQHPRYAYPSTGDKNIRLIVENTLGCRDTLSKAVFIFDKPPINLAFRDTLICPPDNLQLKASGNGIFRWSSLQSIANPDIPDPFVSPLATATYYVDLDDDGCTNTDSVKVRVVHRVTLQNTADPVICEGDDVRLDLATDGLRFEWTPALSLDDAGLKSPMARPDSTTTYSVTAYISACSATEQVTVTTVPYPVALAGLDTSICFDTPAQLHASTDGSSFEWSPATALDNPHSLHPKLRPAQSTQFILYAYDTKGCPKPGTDTVYVNVEPEILPFAGRDTTVVINQPLQLQASGGVFYQWSPSLGLSATDISNPVARFTRTPSEGYHRYKVLVSDATGCTDSAYLQVRIFATEPEIYVPTAFTPNRDGKNDFFQIIAAGIRSIDQFQVYSRWGQLVYDAPVSHSRGWDGMYGGKPQSSGTYVWVVKAIDYTGRPILKKGTVTLIR